MYKEPTFEELELVHDKFKVAWEYIGEGAMGDYNRDDPQDEPLLRFTCFEGLPAFDAKGDQVGWEYTQIENGSYCTLMPIDAPIEVLAKGAGKIMAVIAAGDQDYKRKLQELSHMTYDAGHDGAELTVPDVWGAAALPEQTLMCSNCDEMVLGNGPGIVTPCLKCREKIDSAYPDGWTCAACGEEFHDRMPEKADEGTICEDCAYDLEQEQTGGGA